MIVDIIIGILMLIVIFCAITLMTIYGVINDNNRWNNGRCASCNTELRIKNIDWDGVRYYECPKCKTTVIISYNVEN